VTSGTIFAFHKMPLRQYLAAITIFMNEVKGKSALALSRDLDCQYKTAFERVARNMKSGAARVAMLSIAAQYEVLAERVRAAERALAEWGLLGGFMPHMVGNHPAAGSYLVVVVAT
jgi:hypothetical protein